jgi:outer membrane lipoprotein SlyB
MDTAGSLNKPSALMNIAAIAVIVACLMAVGAVTGVIPSAYSQKQDVAQGQEKGMEAGRSGFQAGSAKVAEACAQCGVIESIRPVEVKGQGTGIGAVAGGVAGAVVGSQFGHGTGRAALGVLGAAGGAYAGHEIEKNVRKTTSWRVSVRMNDGSVRTMSQPAQPAFAVGEKVKVINGALAARG